MLKAIKEAKVHTSWLTPNQPYEEAVAALRRAVLHGPAAFVLAAFLPFQQPDRRGRDDQLAGAGRR